MHVCVSRNVHPCTSAMILSLRFLQVYGSYVGNPRVLNGIRGNRTFSKVNNWAKLPISSEYAALVLPSTCYWTFPSRLHSYSPYIGARVWLAQGIYKILCDMVSIADDGILYYRL